MYTLKDGFKAYSSDMKLAGWQKKIMLKVGLGTALTEVLRQFLRERKEMLRRWSFTVEGAPQVQMSVTFKSLRSLGKGNLRILKLYIKLGYLVRQFRTLKTLSITVLER